MTPQEEEVLSAVYQREPYRTRRLLRLSSMPSLRDDPNAWYAWMADPLRRAWEPGQVVLQAWLWWDADERVVGEDRA